MGQHHRAPIGEVCRRFGDQADLGFDAGLVRCNLAMLDTTCTGCQDVEAHLSPSVTPRYGSFSRTAGWTHPANNKTRAPSIHECLVGSLTFGDQTPFAY